MDSSNTMEINAMCEFGWNIVNYTKGTFSPFYDGDEGFLVATRPEVGVEVLSLQGEVGEERTRAEVHITCEEKP